METISCSEYLKKLKITNTDINCEYLGVDTELNSEILGFFALELEVKSRQNISLPKNDDFQLDEYELAMAG